MKNKILYLLVFNFFPVFIYAQSCDSITPSFNVDLSLNKDSVWESPLVQRNGYCCGTSGTDRCIEFDVNLHSGAWGVVVGYWGSMGPTYFVRRECGKEYLMFSDTIAIAPGKGSSLTFCAGGTTLINYYIKSISCDSGFTLPQAGFLTMANANQVQFYDTSKYSAARIWDFGDGTIDSVYNPVHVYQDTGSYTVKLIAYNGCGVDTLIKIVNVSCLLPVAGFGFTTNDSTVSFSNSSTNATSYLWNFGDGITSTDTNPIYLYSDTGIYNVTLIAYKTCGNDTLSKSVYISCNLITTADFGFTVNDSTVSFLNSSINAISYLWSFGDGTIDSVYNPVHVYQDTGSYEVKLIAYNGCGSDTITQTVSISSISTIIEEEASTYLYKLYPNPANEICVIEFTGNNKNWENMIEVYNYSGKLIKTINVASSRTYSLDTKELSSGIYFIKITNGMWVGRNKLIVR